MGLDSLDCPLGQVPQGGRAERELHLLVLGGLPRAPSAGAAEGLG
jgi:hypothetical protein